MFYRQFPKKIPGPPLTWSWCHPGGIAVAYGKSMRDNLLCPDCGATHVEPLDARLGSSVPCADCTLRAEIDLDAAEFTIIRVAA